MYIRQIYIDGVKLIRELLIPFTRDDKPRMWTVFVGENGVCKTSILQSIALAASGRDRANQLADVPSIPNRRTDTSGVRILADFEFGSLHHREREYPNRQGSDDCPFIQSTVMVPRDWKVFYAISTYIDKNVNPKPLSQVNEAVKMRGRGVYRDKEIDPLEVARAKGLPYWFVAGYGVDRNLPFPKSSERPSDTVRERLNSLFNKGRITATGFADVFTDSEFVHSYIQTLRDALLGHKGILPHIRQLELQSQNGIKTAKDLLETHVFGFEAGKQVVNVPATWLSHGYQATIAWIADLIGQMFREADKPVALDEMEGLVLIDELDLHLHPRWQAGFVRALKATFPRVQFVATTHSPMILPGLEADEIFHLSLDEEGNVQATQADQSPKLMTGSEIYGAFFDIHKLYPEEVGAALSRYGYLASNPMRSDEEEAELEKIIALLKKEGVEPGWEPVGRDGKKAAPKKSTTRRRKRS